MACSTLCMMSKVELHLMHLNLPALFHTGPWLPSLFQSSASNMPPHHSGSAFWVSCLEGFSLLLLQSSCCSSFRAQIASDPLREEPSLISALLRQICQSVVFAGGIIWLMSASPAESAFAHRVLVALEFGKRSARLCGTGLGVSALPFTSFESSANYLKRL